MAENGFLPFFKNIIEDQTIVKAPNERMQSEIWIKKCKILRAFECYTVYERTLRERTESRQFVGEEEEVMSGRNVRG